MDLIVCVDTESGQLTEVFSVDLPAKASTEEIEEAVLQRIGQIATAGHYIENDAVCYSKLSWKKLPQ